MWRRRDPARPPAGADAKQYHSSKPYPLKGEQHLQSGGDTPPRFQGKIPLNLRGSTAFALPGGWGKTALQAFRRGCRAVFPGVGAPRRAPSSRSGLRPGGMKFGSRVLVRWASVTTRAADPSLPERFNVSPSLLVGGGQPAWKGCGRSSCASTSGCVEIQDGVNVKTSSDDPAGGRHGGPRSLPSGDSTASPGRGSIVPLTVLRPQGCAGTLRRRRDVRGLRPRGFRERAHGMANLGFERSCPEEALLM